MQECTVRHFGKSLGSRYCSPHFIQIHDPRFRTLARLLQHGTDLHAHPQGFHYPRKIVNSFLVQANNP